MRYAGLEGGATCRCSDGYNRGGTTTGCTSTCNGDLHEKCGGSSSRASVYEVMAPLWNNTVIGMVINLATPNLSFSIFVNFPW